MKLHSLLLSLPSPLPSPLLSSLPSSLFCSLFVLSSLLGLGCASHLLKKAQDFKNYGRPEIALEYLVAEYQSTAKIEARRALLEKIKQTYRQALKHLDLKIDQLQGSEPLKAYGYLIQQEELMEWMSTTQLTLIDQSSLKQRQRKLQKSIFKKKLRQFDQMEAQNRPDHQLLRAIRPLLALQPNHEELNRRYEALKRRMGLHISLTQRCRDAFVPLCESALDGLADALTHRPSEILHLLPPDAPRSPQRLVLSLQVSVHSTRWETVDEGTVTQEVPQYDQEKKVIETPEGIKVKTVRADYQCLRKVHRVEVVGELIFKDEKSSSKASQRVALRGFKSRRSAQKRSVASFIKWSGDERAFKPSSAIQALGAYSSDISSSNTRSSDTRSSDASCNALKSRVYREARASSPKQLRGASAMNQRPPVSVTQLRRQAWSAVIQDLSQDVGAHLDRFLSDSPSTPQTD